MDTCNWMVEEFFSQNHDFSQNQFFFSSSRHSTCYQNFIVSFMHICKVLGTSKYSVINSNQNHASLFSNNSINKNHQINSKSISFAFTLFFPRIILATVLVSPSCNASWSLSEWNPVGSRIHLTVEKNRRNKLFLQKRAKWTEHHTKLSDAWHYWRDSATVCESF